LRHRTTIAEEAIAKLGFVETLLAMSLAGGSRPARG
jgi:hypothetical protein